jgi:hypothetical protein
MTSVNLMTERAQLCGAAERMTRAWAIVLSIVVVGLAPLAAWTWQQLRHAARQHEALEASYEPIRQLAGANRILRTEAAELVARDRVPLMLSRRRPITALLGAVADAVAGTKGAIVLERLSFTQDGPQSTSAESSGRVIVDVSTTPSFDVSQLVKSLECAPFSAVKITSSQSAIEGDVSRRTYSIECRL